jgi:hypothetical protein
MHEIEIKSKEKFSNQIHRLCRDENLDVVEAITEFCSRNEIEIDDIIPLLDNGLKEDIKVAAIRGRYVRGFKLNELDL